MSNISEARPGYADSARGAMAPAAEARVAQQPDPRPAPVSDTSRVLRWPTEEPFVVGLVPNPERDFANVFMEVLGRMAAQHALGLSQGLLVLPPGTSESSHAQQIATAALHGILTQVSELDDLQRGADAIVKRFVDSSAVFDKAAAQFGAAMKDRKEQLLRTDEA